MNEENFMLVSLNDEKSKEISEVLGSETCKKIINYLIENKEASQKDLSDSLNIPMNTLDYNIKKLVSSGFIQKRKNFFWSSKGKKIIMYEISNRSIVISHKKPNKEKIKSIIPGFILIFATTFAVFVFERLNSIKNSELNIMPSYDAFQTEIVRDVSTLSKVAQSIPAELPSIISEQPFPLWGWFLAGGVLAMIIFSIVNWRKL